MCSILTRMTKIAERWIIALCTKQKHRIWQNADTAREATKKGLQQQLAACVQNFDHKSDISIPKNGTFFQNDQRHQVMEKRIEHREL